LKQKHQPTAEEAQAYIRQGIYGKGGYKEAWGGLIHKSIPDWIGSRKSVTLSQVLAFLVRLLVIVVAALFPLLIRKLTTPSSNQLHLASGSVFDSVHSIGEVVVTASSLDYVLAVISLLIVVAPRILDVLSKKAKSGKHAPFLDLTAAIRKIPVQTGQKNQRDTDESIRLTLLALREEMALLSGEIAGHGVTDVTLLEFCDSNGQQMQVRARTANHEEVRRPVQATRFVAYYVAKEGRNFVEHDFKNSRNPFPPKRLTVKGNLNVDYRSVLYLPIMCSERQELPQNAHGPMQVIDQCVGVICIHSAKAYRFWRWGDHKKGVGGFADVAFGRAMPYIALVERLLSNTTPRVKLEVQ
jgi:hypothetical protein